VEAAAIRIDRADGVLTLTLHRPDKKNALTVAMYDTLREQLLRAADDDAIRAVLLCGGDNYFCAGNDIGGFAAVRALPAEQRPGFRFMRTLVGFPKPIVAAVTGDAVGIGATLLLHCDLVYASAAARFRFPFVDVGLVPEFASTLLLPRMAGHAGAAGLLLLGESFTAQQAQAIGLVGTLVPAEQLVSRAVQAALSLAKKPNAALQATKRLLKQPLLDDVLRVMDAEMRELNQRLDSGETQAILATLLAKPATPKRV
jgi:enoyl-CoA hydratase/carnithine racemase